MALAQGDVRRLAGMPGCVDAHQQARLRIGREEDIEIGPGLLFQALLHGIFQVDDDRVGAAGQSLGDALGTRRRDK
ncbi:hypothetical protein D9M68_969540 [compost metagenome]